MIVILNTTLRCGVGYDLCGLETTMIDSVGRHPLDRIVSPVACPPVK